MCFYNADAPGGPELVINAKYAADPDLALREYCHHLLATNRPDGPPRYEGETNNYWPHFAIESALAFYLPCSFHNNPKFGEISRQTDDKVIAINLIKPRKLTELKGDMTSAYGNDAEVWGNLFWELRSTLTREKIDGLLVRAWFGLRETVPLNAQRQTFGNAILNLVTQELGPDASTQTKKIFAAHGLLL